jgi:hypothetical protein
MDHDPVRDIVLAGALPAAFESACLLRCADLRRPASMTGNVLAEFDHEDAAARLASLLAGLGCAADREVRTGGGRRRYDLYRVLVGEPRRPGTGRLLAAAWRQGRQALLSAETLGASSPRHTQRVTLAHAAWRAALLAGGRRRRGDLLWVRTGDQEMAGVLVRAARLIGETSEVSRRPGCFMVAVPLHGVLSAA